jgi:hypothetical protein
MIKTFLLGLLALVVLITGFWLGIEATEKKECYQWQLDSKSYSANWFVADWQVEQCRHYGIDIK